jgi:hypothetical protein
MIIGNLGPEYTNVCPTVHCAGKKTFTKSHQEEDSQCDQNGNSECDFVVAEIEDERCQERDEEAGDDQVASEEERLAAQNELIRYVHVLLRSATTCVQNAVPLRGQL